jgi:hypothetical protein
VPEVDWLIDYLRFYVPFKNCSLIWRMETSPLPEKLAKFCEENVRLILKSVFHRGFSSPLHWPPLQQQSALDVRSPHPYQNCSASLVIQVKLRHWLYLWLVDILNTSFDSNYKWNLSWFIQGKFEIRCHVHCIHIACYFYINSNCIYSMIKTQLEQTWLQMDINPFFFNWYICMPNCYFKSTIWYSDFQTNVHVYIYC